MSDVCLTQVTAVIDLIEKTELNDLDVTEVGKDECLSELLYI